MKSLVTYDKSKKTITCENDKLIPEFCKKCIKDKSKKCQKFYDDLLEKSPSKERVTEVNNSYYLSKELAFNKDNLQEKRELLENEISQMEFEISKFNSETFEV